MRKKEHRKSIFELVKNEGFEVKENQLENIKKMFGLSKMDIKRHKKYGFVKTLEPGKILGIDLIEISKTQRIVMAIDYFSRFLFCKSNQIKACL